MATRAAACQLTFSYFNTPQEFADSVRLPIELAAEHGAQLILLPHSTSSMLFGIFDAGARSSDSLDGLAARQKRSTREWLRERAGYLFELYLHVFQSLAGRVERWLAPGTVLEVEGDSLFLTCLLLNPAGEIVGRQRKIHPTPAELEWGVQPGEAVRVLETEVGDVGFLIGEDVNHPETARALERAQVLLHPAAPYVLPPANSETPRETFGAEFKRAVQMHDTFGVQAALAGGTYRGRAAIYAPVELSPDRSGVLARATNDAAGELVLADLDFDALNDIRAARPFRSVPHRTA
jgi:predicted amidohydrolase